MPTNTSVYNAGVNASNIYRINTSDNNRNANSSPSLQGNLPNESLVGLKDTFVKDKKKYGLVEKFYNFCKNKTGFGLGSNKVEQKIVDYENGKATEEEAKKKISDYKISQENSAQNFGDLTSAAVGIGGYIGLSNLAKKINARIKLNALGQFEYVIPEKVLPKIKAFLNSSKKTKAVIIPLVVLASGLTKLFALKFNRIGSKEFKVENKEKLSKQEFKKQRKLLRRQRHKLNFKNFYTGAINGLLAPITALAGGVVGVPAYILSTSGIRFLTSKNDNKDKSLKNYTENLKNNAALNTLFAAAIAIPAFRKAHYSKVLGENLNKVVKNLKDVKLEAPDLGSTKTAYGELEDIMLGSDRIQRILSNPSVKADEAIKRLTQENIFAVKFLQISNRGGEISSKLIEDCPPSRTIDVAQRDINRLLGSSKYKVTKLLGVGTVAESYLAKDSSGKEVCIKILKSGINSEKIKKDKESFIKMVTGGSGKKQLTKSQQYLIKNIENMAEALSKEVDFENELKAAKKLAKCTRRANVVVPLEAKKGVYVMEKAPGISLDTLVKYYRYEYAINDCERGLDAGGDEAVRAKKKIADYNKRIQKLKAKSPDFKDFNLSTNEIKLLLNEYIGVLTEQLVKVGRNGRTLHADIHPGNIFINLEALKKRKGKLFTLIDTGNTIDLIKEQAVASVKLTSYVKNGNVKDIAKYVLNGAILPGKMTQQEAAKLVEHELKPIFFDNKTQINSMSADELFTLTNNILRKHDIIPNDTQLNLNKAKKSASRSLGGLANSFFNKKYANVDVSTKTKEALQKANFTKDVTLFMTNYMRAKTMQETKNLFQMSFKELINTFRNPNMIKTNSEDYLTYKLKQDIELDAGKKKRH